MLFAVGLMLVPLGSLLLAEGPNLDIKALYNDDLALAQVESLVGFGPRVAGGSAEAAAAEYIAMEMESFGLDVEVQEFPIIYFEELSLPALEQVSPHPTVYQVDTYFATMDYSGSGDVTAMLQAVDLDLPPTGASTSGCEADDFIGFAHGNIALIQRGTCYYSVKAQNAQDAGAVGVLIFNEGNTPDRVPLMYEALGGPGISIPVQSASHALGVDLYNLSLADKVKLYMSVDTITEDRMSRNVIGTREGTDPEQGIVYIGGH